MLVLVQAVLLLPRLCVGASAGAGEGESPLTSSGSLVGSSVVTPHGRVWRYLGVRYAEAPRRFEPPQPYEVADRDRLVDALEWPAPCSQPPHSIDLMYEQLSRGAWNASLSEDCLFLNVFVPESSSSSSSSLSKAVMVWLPGEGFDNADASHLDASQLAAQGDVIVVTPNYRVGAHGFLSWGSGAAPGNQGVWDVLEALRWVRRNAAALGGDARRVTLMGHYTGAVLASALLASPRLMQRDRGDAQPYPLVVGVVLQSGVAADSYTFASDPANQTLQLAKALGCRGSANAIIECLRTIPNEQFCKASWTLEWKPVIDGNLFPMTTAKAVRKSTHNRNINVIIGEASNVGSICLQMHFYMETVFSTHLVSNNLTKNEFVQLLKWHTKDFTQIQDQSVLDAVVHEYRPWSLTNASYRDIFINFCGELYTRAKAEQLARLLAKSGSTVWRYEFDHRPSISRHPTFLKAALFDELIFMFSLLGNSGTDKEKALSQEVVTMWSNFAKTGNPNVGIGEEKKSLFTWPQFTDSSRQMYVLTTDSVKLKTSDFLSRAVDFWNSVVPSLSKSCLRLAKPPTCPGCGRKKNQTNTVPCVVSSCPGYTGLTILSIILGVALLLLGLYLFQLVRGKKGLLMNEHSPQ